MYAHENMVNLTRYALPLEAYVRGEEERAASLEATLSPQYRAYGTYYPNIYIYILLVFYSLPHDDILISMAPSDEGKPVAARRDLES